MLFHYCNLLFRNLLARLLAGKKRRAPYWETIVTALLTSSIGYCTEKKGGGKEEPRAVDLMPPCVCE